MKNEEINMTKQEVLDALKNFSEYLNKEAFREIQANKENFTSELLESLEYVRENAYSLYEEAKNAEELENEYFFHTYAMFLLAEFKEKRAFPQLIAWLRLPQKYVDFIIGDSLTEDFDRILLCTYDAEHLQLLFDIIENQELYEWARNAALRTYMLLHIEGQISKDDFISYLRSLIYEKLISEESYMVNTAIVDCIMDARIYEMISDARFLHENDKVDESMHGGYDDFLDWIFFEKPYEKKPYIENALAEIENWACFENDEDDSEENKDDLNDKDDKDVDFSDVFAGIFGDDIEKEREIEQAFAQKQAALQNMSTGKKPGRNDPCPCGSGKKYKKCCIDTEQTIIERPTAVRIEDKYDLLERYPKDDLTIFKELYEEEAVNIDIPVYKALHHRSIPIWVKRDLKQERLGKINYLNEALELFLDKCEREQIVSFAAYDEKYMVHYRSAEWVESLIDLTKDDNSSKIMNIRKTALNTLKRFEK